MHACMYVRTYVYIYNDILNTLYVYITHIYIYLVPGCSKSMDCTRKLCRNLFNSAGIVDSHGLKAEKIIGLRKASALRGLSGFRTN